MTQGRDITKELAPEPRDTINPTGFFTQPTSNLRGMLVAALFFTITPLLIGIQWLMDKLHLPGWGVIAVSYYRAMCWGLGIRIRIVGEPVRDRAVLFVSNHCSWADIMAIGAVARIAFVSKIEVAKWPLVGTAARLQRTVFVDRSRRAQTGDSISEMADRLTSGVSVVLFAEGTSSDGNRVLPFRSALIGAVREAAAQVEGGMLIQPMSICYTAINGIPMGRQHRPLVAWYGDTDFMPHIKAFLPRAAIDVTISYGTPIPADASTNRKVLAKEVESAVRALVNTSVLGRPYPGTPAAAQTPA
jgi:1-acyl-sn-glycerol-3-phosphate acyltransferase